MVLKSEKQKMLSGELYDASDKELTHERISAKNLLYKLNVSEYSAEHGPAYSKIINLLMPNASGDIYIEPPFYCDYGYNIFTKEKVYLNHNVVILDVMPVYIGYNTMIGPNVQIYAATHPKGFELRRKMLENAKSITIGDDCWIGGGAIICPGVSIGDRCVIGAGSVVTKDVPSDSLVVGNPARIIESLK